MEPLGDRVVPAAGLVLSEVLTNPSGNDSPLEYVELVATRDINFAVTPYTVVFADTTASPGAAGWANGGVRSYAFAITTGTVTRGSVVYVGGSGMAPTGTKLRTLNTATTGGDGFGSAQAAGVLGNGGSHADGVAVFDVAVGSITSSAVPVDALLFGTTVGTAAGANYQLPVSDHYTGGTANAGSFVAPDPGTNQILTASGVLDPVAGTWATGRSWSLGTTTTSGTSGVALLPVVTVAAITDAAEGGANGVLRFTRTGSTSAALTVSYAVSGSATAGTDYTALTGTVTFAAGSATADVAVAAIDDVATDAGETVSVAVTGGTGYSVGSPSSAAVTIIDDEAAPNYWLGGTGDWNTAANWSLGVPTSTSALYFDASHSNASVTIPSGGSGTTQFAELHLVSGYTGTVTLSNNVTVRNLELTSGTLDQPVTSYGSDLTVTAALLWTGGTLNSTAHDATLTVSGVGYAPGGSRH